MLKRVKATSEQVEMLEAAFKSDCSLRGMKKMNLAKKSGLTERFIEIWFQNKRANIKKKKAHEARKQLEYQMFWNVYFETLVMQQILMVIQ
jgi:hypothetical protein